MELLLQLFHSVDISFEGDWELQLLARFDFSMQSRNDNVASPLRIQEGFFQKERFISNETFPIQEMMHLPYLVLLGNFM